MHETPTPDTHPTLAHSIWPLIVAAGFAQAMLGLITGSIPFEVTGVLAMLAGVVGWLREL